MNRFAILGPVDPQLAGFPAHAYVRLAHEKPIKDLKEDWYMLAQVSEMAIEETARLVTDLVKSPDAVSRLTNGDTTHGLGITYQEAMEMGLPVSVGIPQSIMAIADRAIAASKTQEFKFPGLP